tara:strand:+ start:212 stop:478 length:267 start_codon:yes stop_codon:yes gene_type:complete
MRTLLLALPLFLVGCIDGVIDDDCDVYVDYLCTCGVDDCEQLQNQFADADLAVQEQCRIDLACFEDADTTNGETCSLIPDQEDQCLAN